MKKLLFTALFFLGAPFSAHAAPTSTIVQNLFITGLNSTGAPCLYLNTNNLVSVASSTCGTGSGSGITSLQGLSTSSITFATSASGTTYNITTSGDNVITLTIPKDNAFFTNGVGYVTSSVVSGYATSGGPVSQFTNDVPYATSVGVTAGLNTKQASDTDLYVLAAPTPDTFIYSSGSAGYVFVSSSTARLKMLATILQNLNNLLTAADQLPYANGAGTWATTSLSAVSRSLIALTSSSSWLTQLGGCTGLANPSASVGTSVVNGVATTCMRSDGAPALDLTISPNWTGSHQFAFVSSTQIRTPSSTLGNTNFTNGTSSTNLALSYSTASRCLRLDANKNIVAATGDCTAGDTNTGTESGWRADGSFIWQATSTTEVGIGATSSLATLFVGGMASPSSTTSVLFLTPNATNSPSSIIGGSASGTVLAINVTSTYNGDLLNAQVGNTTKFKVSATGTGLAVGTSTAPSMLTVNGSVSFLAVRQVTASTTLTQTDFIVEQNSTSTQAKTLTLPFCGTAGGVGLGKLYILKDGAGVAGTTNLTIGATSTELIDGAPTKVITSNYGSVSIYCNPISIGTSTAQWRIW